MIQSFTVTNHNGRSMVCDLANPWKEGLAVASIEGLGPGQANINVADISSMDGGLFNSARRGSRNIVFNLVFTDHDTLTIEDIRRKCYTYFPLKKNVKLKFTTSDGKTLKDYYIEGHVESNEPNIFSSAEGATVSVICPQPNFYRGNPQQNVFSLTADPNFVFGAYNQTPYFWRDSQADPQTKLRMGDIVSFIVCNMVYDGTADTGLIFEIVFNSSVAYDPSETPEPMIRITNSLTNTENYISLNKIYETMKARDDIGDEYTGIVPGDILEFSTVQGRKYLTYVHNGIAYNMLHAVKLTNGDWVYLSEGNNILGIEKPSAVKIAASSTNRIYFMGV